MKITDAFLGEHGTLYAMLDYLEKAKEKIEEQFFLSVRSADLPD